MNKFDVVRIVADIIEERDCLDSFNISYVSDLIIVAMMVGNHCISEVISMEKVETCNEPRYMIRLIINNMINKLQGGTVNDQEC